jgi:hypothetical protein
MIVPVWRITIVLLKGRIGGNSMMNLNLNGKAIVAPWQQLSDRYTGNHVLNEVSCGEDH